MSAEARGRGASNRVLLDIHCDGCGEWIDIISREFCTVRNLLDSTTPRRGHRRCIDYRYIVEQEALAATGATGVGEGDDER